MKRIFIGLLVLLMALSIGIWISCEKKFSSSIEPVSPTEDATLGKVNAELRAVMDVQNRHTDVLLAKAGVVGTATALLQDGKFAVKILTREAGIEKSLPTMLENVPVVVEVVGEIKALSYTGRYRPVQGGVSGGNINDRKKVGPYISCSGGTIGCVVQKSGNSYFLSNNHVFARENAAAIGEDIVQPGLIEVNCSQITNDVVADLSEFKAITFKRTANNKIDAAIAMIRPGIDFSCGMICGYTPSATPVTAALNMAVKKCGRTTEYTTGTVNGLNVTVLISYSKGTARFIGQVQFTDMSDSGDSGSLIVTQSGNNPVALLFAGSSTTTIGNPIQDVLSNFGVTVCGN